MTQLFDLRSLYRFYFFYVIPAVQLSNSKTYRSSLKLSPNVYIISISIYMVTLLNLKTMTTWRGFWDFYHHTSYPSISFTSTYKSSSGLHLRVRRTNKACHFCQTF